MRHLLTGAVQINWRMRVTLNDGRSMAGQMLAFDKVHTAPREAQHHPEANAF